MQWKRRDGDPVASASRRRRLARVVRAALPFLVLPLLADALFVSRILESTGERLCPTLDDAFIHFEYARSLVEGRPLSYNPGDPATTGATSFLYIGLLAVGWALGVRGLGMTWLAHGIAVACLGIASWAAHRIGQRLAGAPAGWACALSVMIVPQYVFEALGGMEIALVTAAHLGAILAAVEWVLRPRSERTPRLAALVCFAGMLAAAARPEGVTAAAGVALVLALAPGAKVALRGLGVLALAPAALPGWVAYASTGQNRTTGQLAKWMFADPYLDFHGALEASMRNVERLFGELLAGSHAPFVVPERFHWLVVVGLVAMTIGLALRHRARGVLVSIAFLIASSAVFIPATYWTFDTNRGRYLWPFIPVLAVGAVLGATLVGRALARSRLRMHAAPGALAATVLVVLFVKPVEALERITDSAAEICEQHVNMAARVRELPRRHVVAVNDAGALRYLTDHRIYDLVGLTTPGAAVPWNAGMGSVFERLEREPEARRPRYVAFHPNWLRLPIAGDLVHAIRVEHAHHLGGEVMELRHVRTALFDSGARPVMERPEGRVVDELDTADLESEREHEHSIGLPGRGTNFVRVFDAGARPVADGGRLLVGEQRFVLRARPAEEATLVFRMEPRSSCRMTLEWNGRELEPVEIEAGAGWREVSVVVPARRVSEVNRIARRCPSAEESGIYHDWLYQ